MSSQGPASSTNETTTGYTTTGSIATGSAQVGTVTPRGYRYSYESIRNASDYTEFIRQQKTYTSYVGASAPNENRPEIYGSWFRLQYLLGRHKRSACGTTGCTPDGTIARQIRGEIGES